MPYAEDFSLFFADFGEDATLAGQPVRVIFEDPHEIYATGGAGQAGRASQVTLSTASVPPAVYGAAVVLPGRGAFTVLEHLPDGTGLSVLRLQRA